MHRNPQIKLGHIKSYGFPEVRWELSVKMKFPISMQNWKHTHIGIMAWMDWHVRPGAMDAITIGPSLYSLDKINGLCAFSSLICSLTSSSYIWSHRWPFCFAHFCTLALPFRHYLSWLPDCPVSLPVCHHRHKIQMTRCPLQTVAHTVHNILRACALKWWCHFLISITECVTRRFTETLYCGTTPTVQLLLHHPTIADGTHFFTLLHHRHGLCQKGKVWTSVGNQN